MRPQPVPAWSGRATAQARPYMVSDRMILAAQPGAMPPAARLALLGVDVVDPGDGGPGLMLARSWGEGNNEGMLGRAMFSGCIDKERQHLVAGAVLLRIGKTPLDGATFAEKLRQARGALPPPRVVAGSAAMRARRRVEMRIERRTYRDVPDAAAWVPGPRHWRRSAATWRCAWTRSWTSCARPRRAGAARHGCAASCCRTRAARPSSARGRPSWRGWKPRH